MLEQLLGMSKTVSRWFAWLGGALIIASAFLVGTEVILRKFFNISFGGADELSGYAFGVSTVLGLAFALFERAHIRVDATYFVFPMPVKIAVNFLGLILLTSFAGVVAWTSWGMVADTLQQNSHSITPLRVPLSYPQIPWLIGWIYFVMVGILMIFVAVQRLMQGRLNAMDRLIGIKSLNQHIEDERVSEC